MIDQNTTYRLADNISFTEIDDEMVLLNLNSGSYFGLNKTGIDILKLLIDGSTVATIAPTLAEKYQVSAETLNSDIDALIKELLDSELIHA